MSGKLLKLQAVIFKIIFTSLVKMIFFYFLSHRNLLNLNLTGFANLVGFGFFRPDSFTQKPSKK